MEFQEVQIIMDGVQLLGLLAIPLGAKGIVLFAHGSGSGRLSPRNQFVARILVEGGVGALLVDLLTPEEEIIDERTHRIRFDVPFLAERLLMVTHWMQRQKPLKIGYFGASTGAAAALVAAAQRTDIAAVVSRGGRPDLAGALLSKVRSPTLLLVGGADFGVIELNESAFADLTCEKKFEIVPHATHLFEEKGTLDKVAKSALEWFQAHF